MTMPGLENLPLTLADFDRHYDLSKVYNVGFKQQNTFMNT